MTSVGAALFAATSTDLMQARWLMALSLGSHIILSCLGVALPTLIFVVHRRGLRNGDADALALARRLGKCAAVLFAVGAVSGTVLSFEMGILWPGMMGTFGDVIGLPFALEGIFFFLEAIFLGIYLYGWRGLPARLHLATLIPIALSGVAGTFCIVAVNAWMNNPAGFDLVTYAETGRVVDVDPWAAMFNGNVWIQFAHLLPATYVVTGFLVASVYAVGWARGRRDRLHRLGLEVGLLIGCVAIPLQLVTGDLIARHAAANQPVKFAAMELIPSTDSGVPMTLGGLYIDGEVVGAIEIPYLTSLILDFDPDATVVGLDSVPPEDRPPENVVHLSFQLMVLLGTALAALAAWTGWVWWRRRDLPRSRWWLRAVILSGPAAVLALEAGWTTTEVGRQPWIAYEVMRVAEAVTGQPGVGVILVGLIAVYLGLGASLWFVLHRMSARWRAGEEVATPYGPPGAEQEPVVVGTSVGGASERGGDGAGSGGSGEVSR
ncbi:MAG: cytochrome ubiquinol oxidase subunit I [Ilumatobacteraceae bacterium]|nr:cytochrome ubiquinol oxidase subunit I [Ilumatobacteraceae bacterium]